MNLEQAIKTALQYENKVTDVYRVAATKASGETGKKIFGLLAKEEEEHVEYLESRLRQWQETGKVTAEVLKTAVPPRKVIAEGLKRLKKGVSDQDHSAELDLLKQALAAEKETSEFYRSVVSELDGEGQALFERFVEIEEGHYAIVQAQIDSLSGMGFWFDFMEFDLEAG